VGSSPSISLLDVPLEPASPRLQRAGRAFNRIPQLRYPTLEHAVRRFQPFPTPHRIAPAVLGYLARHSFKPLSDGDGGYTSKFHWKSYQRDRSREGNPLAAHGARLRALRIPVASVRATESTILGHDDQQEMLARLPDGHGFEIADATHSLHAEQPAAVTAALRDFLGRP
jgi:pimeloyl-ACP methyl ester carboxylesterase